jgi:dissimilatory sulfite reductase (desulfoviridin) alpha/beta subunit
MSFLTRRVARRLGPIGVALTIYDIWSRLPEREQEHLIALARKHGVRSFKVIKRHSAKIQRRFA